MSQHSRSSDFLSIDLTSIHVLQGLLGLLRGLKLHVRVASGQVWVEPVHWEVNHLNFPISREDLLDVVLGDVPGQPAQVNFSGFGTRASFPAFLVITPLLCFRSRARAATVVMASAAGARRA